MNQLLKRAFDAVELLPKPEQEEIARLVLALANEGESEEIPATHLPAVLNGLAQADRDEFASDEEIAATFHRFG